MILRDGFVSNSSSSSFIIAIPQSTRCPCCGRSNDGVEDFLYNHDVDIIAETADGIVEHIEAMYHQYDNLDINNMYKNDIEKIARLKKAKDKFPDAKFMYININSYDQNMLRSIIGDNNIIYDSGY